MLEIRNIRKSFWLGGKEMEVLRGINLTVEDGEFLSLIGSNGSGKSTLLRIVCGELGADSGLVRLDGLSLTGLPAYRRAQYMTFVRQAREQNLVSSLRVCEVLDLVAGDDRSWLKIVGLWRKGNVGHLLSTVNENLSRHLKDQVWSLSGGEHQSLALLVAAEILSVGRGKLLLLDEHVAHLDPKTSRSVLELTRGIAIKNNLTVIMVTHDLQAAADCSSRVVAIRDGTVFLDLHYDDHAMRNKEVLGKALEV